MTCKIKLFEIEMFDRLIVGKRTADASLNS